MNTLLNLTLLCMICSANLPPMTFIPVPASNNPVTILFTNLTSA